MEWPYMKLKFSSLIVNFLKFILNSWMMVGNSLLVFMFYVFRRAPRYALFLRVKNAPCLFLKVKNTPCLFLKVKNAPCPFLKVKIAPCLLLKVKIAPCLFLEVKIAPYPFLEVKIAPCLFSEMKNKLCPFSTISKARELDSCRKSENATWKVCVRKNSRIHKQQILFQNAILFLYGEAFNKRGE